MVSFTAKALYPQGKSCRCPLYRRQGGPQSCSGRGDEEKKLLALPGIQPRSSNVVTVLTELSQNMTMWHILLTGSVFPSDTLTIRHQLDSAVRVSRFKLSRKLFWQIDGKDYSFWETLKLTSQREQTCCWDPWNTHPWTGSGHLRCLRPDSARGRVHQEDPVARDPAPANLETSKGSSDATPSSSKPGNIRRIQWG